MKRTGFLFIGCCCLLSACTPTDKEAKATDCMATETSTHNRHQTVVDSLAQLIIPADERVTDSNVDLRHYFDSLRRHTKAELWIHRQDDPDTVKVWEAIDKLSAFVRNERKTYPVKEVRESIYLMGLEQAYLHGHGGWEESTWNGEQPNPGELFLFQFIEKAVYYCPRIEFLTDEYSPNKRVGVITIPTWSGYPLYDFIVYRTREGYKTQLCLSIRTNN